MKKLFSILSILALGIYLHCNESADSKKDQSTESLMRLVSSSPQSGASRSTKPTNVNQSTESPTVSFITGTYPVGVAITSVKVTTTNCDKTPCSFSITPALPSGLSLDTRTGTLSGTPTSITGTTSYTITVKNNCKKGSDTATNNQTVISTPALVVQYPSNISTAYYPPSTAITLTPSATSATNVTYSITGTLGDTLQFNTTNGSIIGTTASQPINRTVSVTATNSSGTVTTSLTSINVVSVASLTCNTTGVAEGCTSSQPFKCSNSSVCYSTYSSCVQTAPAGVCQY
jgi:hypothetical protein